MFPKKALFTEEHRSAKQGCKVLPPILPTKVGRVKNDPTLELKSKSLLAAPAAQHKGPTLKLLWVTNTALPIPL